MDQYIKQLLLLYSKIILPEFGAIVIVNEETGELSFNEYLNYDDGKLSSLLESESNMDLQDAQNSIAKFVRELKLQLNKGETYAIFQLGEFSKDKDGSFIFSGNIKTIEKANVPIKKEEDIPKAKIEEIEKNIEKETAVPKLNPKEETSDPKGVKRNVYVEKNKEVKSTSTLKNDKKAVIVEKKKKSSKGFLFWFLLFLIILILSGTTLVLINQEKVEEYMGWTMFDKKEPKTDTTIEKIVLEEEQEETIPEKVEIIEEKIAEVIESVEKPNEIIENTITPSNGQYHIVIGCFGNKSNANGLVTEFKEKGYDSNIISQTGGLYFVAAQSYSSFTAANSEISKIRQYIDGAWVYKN